MLLGNHTRTCDKCKFFDRICQKHGHIVKWDTAVYGCSAYEILPTEETRRNKYRNLVACEVRRMREALPTEEYIWAKFVDNLADTIDSIVKGEI